MGFSYFLSSAAIRRQKEQNAPLRSARNPSPFSARDRRTGERRLRQQRATQRHSRHDAMNILNDQSGALEKLRRRTSAFFVDVVGKREGPLRSEADSRTFIAGEEMASHRTQPLKRADRATQWVIVWLPRSDAVRAARSASLDDLTALLQTVDGSAMTPIRPYACRRQRDHWSDEG